MIQEAELCIKCKQHPRVKGRRVCRPCKNVQANSGPSKSPEYRDSYHAKYYEKNKVTIRAQKRQNYADNTLKHIHKGINKRSKIYGHELLEYSDLERLVNEFIVCEDCGAADNLTVGHRIPLVCIKSNNHFENLIRQCTNCNSKQHARVHVSAATPGLCEYYRIYVPKCFSSEKV